VQYNLGFESIMESNVIKSDDWQVYFDESSQSYYKYNPRTNESYWMNSNNFSSSNNDYISDQSYPNSYVDTNEVFHGSTTEEGRNYQREEEREENDEESEVGDKGYDDDSSVSSWDSEMEEDFQLLLKTKEGQSIFQHELQNVERILEHIQNRRNFWSISSWFQPFQGTEFFNNVKLNRFLIEQDSNSQRISNFTEGKDYSSSSDNSDSDHANDNFRSAMTKGDPSVENKRLIKRQKKKFLLEDKWIKAADETKLLRSVFPRRNRRKIKRDKKKEKMIFKMDQGYNSVFSDIYDDDSYYDQDKEGNIDTERELSSENDIDSDSTENEDEDEDEDEDDQDEENDEEESLGALFLEVSYLLCKVAVNHSLNAGSKIATFIGLQRPGKKLGRKHRQKEHRKEKSRGRNYTGTTNNRRISNQQQWSKFRSPLYFNSYVGNTSNFQDFLHVTSNAISSIININFFRLSKASKYEGKRKASDVNSFSHQMLDRTESNAL